MAGSHPNSERSPFDPYYQTTDLDSKLVVLLERISEVFKVALLEEGKHWQLSPLQIQIMVFMHHHSSRLRTVSYLAKEFNVSKPTISEAVRTLEQKNLITRQFNEEDGRSHSLLLTPSGVNIAERAQHFAHTMVRQLHALSHLNKPVLYHDMLQLLLAFQKAGLVGESRMCLNCAHLRTGSSNPADYTCMLLGHSLSVQDLRVDCPEFNI